MHTIHNYSILVWQEGPWWVSHCLNKEVASQGKTKQEALDNIHEAITLLEEVEEDRSLPTIGHSYDPYENVDLVTITA